MATKILNGANKKILVDSLRRKGFNVSSVKTISKATKNSAGKYKVTFKK